MNKRVSIPLVLAATLGVAVGVIGGSLLFPSTAVAKDDPVKTKEARDKFRKAQEEKGVMTYFDLEYGCDRGPKDKPKVDSRWTHEASPANTKDDDGLQFVAQFSDSKFPEGSGIRVAVQKFAHKSPGSQRPNINLPFEHANLKPLTADKQGMAEGYQKEWMAVLKDPVKEKCFEPKKVKAGPAELWGSAVGSDPDSGGKRVRRDIYIWVGGAGAGFTYAAVCSYTGVCAEKSDLFEEKVTELLKNTKELKAPD